MNQYFKWQAQLAGAKMGVGSEAQGNAMHDRVGPQGTVPDDIPDIGMMVPIDRTN
jgi:hypothetical protein